MKGIVERHDLTEKMVDPETGEQWTDYLGFVWRVTCPSHGEVWESDWEQQARALARDTSSFCMTCLDEARREAHLLPFSDDTEAAQLENRRLCRAEESEREMERT